MQKSSLTLLVTQLLDTARAASSGRSAHTLYGGSGHVLRQTLIALREGQKLDEHDNPGEATLHVLFGDVRLATADAAVDGSAGEILVIPEKRHSLEARADAVVLLTAAKTV